MRPYPGSCTGIGVKDMICSLVTVGGESSYWPFARIPLFAYLRGRRQLGAFLVGVG